MPEYNHSLDTLKAFRRAVQESNRTSATDANAKAMEAISAELREALFEIDECHVDGKSIVGPLSAAHACCDILDRISGLDPKRLLDE